MSKPTHRRPGGRAAERGPFRVTRRVLWQAYYQFDKDDAWTLAGHIAYMGIFAIFPFLIFLLAIAGTLGQGEAATQSIQLALDLLPPPVRDGISPAIAEVRNAPHAGLITFSVLVTLWASSSGLEALRHALNRAYDVADRPSFLRSRLESLALTVLAAIAVIVAMVLLFVVPLVQDIVAWLIGQAFPEQLSYPTARYLIGIGILLSLIMILYKLLPNIRLRPREIWPGAVAAWAAWLLVQWAYTLYIRFVPPYSVTYGSLGGIIVTLFFFYISALLFIFGAEINSVLKRRRDNRQRLP